MHLKGTITQALPPQSGVSRAGKEWRKQEYILQTTGNYPKTVCVAVMGDNIEKLNLQPFNVYDLSVDVESHEFNGRWYTSVLAWGATTDGSAPNIPASDPFTDDKPY